MEFLSEKSSFAIIFASSVLPTPLFPIKRKTPFGLSGLFIPLSLLIIAFISVSMAFSCPKTAEHRFSSTVLKLSFEFNPEIGIPVISFIISSTSFALTVGMSDFSFSISKSPISSR